MRGRLAGDMLKCMSGNQLTARRRRRSPLVTGFLVVLTIAGLVLTAGGTAYAVLANMPDNRETQPLWPIAVEMGRAVAFMGVALTALSITALALWVRRRR